MLGVKLSIIFIVLFLSFSVILLSEEVNINSMNNNATNNSNNKHNTPENNFKNEIIIGLIMLIVGSLFGVIIDKKTIRYKEKRDTLKEARKVFHDFLIKIKHEEFTYSTYLSDIVNSNMFNLDSAFESIIFNVGNRKRKKIRIAYEEYKQPYHKTNPDIFNNIGIYDFGKKEMIEVFGENPPFKTGKELLIYNLQNILDLLK